MSERRTGAARDPVDISLEVLSAIVRLARACVRSPSDGVEESCSRTELDVATQELREAVEALPDDERAVLLALAWVGRGDFGAEDFDTALTQAFDAAAGSISAILLDLPRLGDWLEEGAVACGADLNQVSGQAVRARNDLLH